MHTTNFEFVNHASVLIKHGEVGILSDPWYEGSVFHYGWRLICEQKQEKVSEILNKTSHIYISHEHPDHFNPGFFLKEENQVILKKRNIEILFQYTKDKRVIKFLRKQGLKVREFELNEKVRLSKNVETEIVKHDFYDSSLIIRTPDIKILNLNDCPMRNERELIKFKEKYGTFDLLLTQFSYAAWKGGVDNKDYRKKAAQEKLQSVEKQAHILECKTVIPFASFIYFSNKLNFYMNDFINTPEIVKNFFSGKKMDAVIFSPGEKQEVKDLKQKQTSLDFWKNKYSNMNYNNKDRYNESVKLEDLESQFNVYKKRIFDKNSKFLIFFLAKIHLMSLFQNIKIKLYDQDKILNYSIFNGLDETSSDDFDILMHSQSLSFIFKNEFGFDTLTVNGCFEATKSGFEKSAKSLSIGSLNSLGFNLNLKLIYNYRFILLFLKKLKKVLKNIDRSKN